MLSIYIPSTHNEVLQVLISQPMSLTGKTENKIQKRKINWKGSDKKLGRYLEPILKELQ